MHFFMESILTKLRTEYKANSLNKYTKPKIYHGGKSFDLTKRWYVYYSFEHPTKVTENGHRLMIQQPPIYYNINRNYKTKTERLKAIKQLRNNIESLLKDGWTPYALESEARYTAKAALNFALKLKKSTLKKTSYDDYSNRLSHFLEYLRKKGLSSADINSVNKKTVNDFLNSLLTKSSARNRNNTRSVLSALFTILEDNELIDNNFIKNIKPLKTTSTRNKTYTGKGVDDIYKYLEKEDPIMLLFIKFVSYNFLRPIEVCRLKSKDINLKESILHIDTKTSAAKTKRIPSILLKELIDLDLSSEDDFLFTPTGVGRWEAEERNRRDHFSKRYKKIKTILGYGPDHTIYSFRHTFITKLYRDFRKTQSPFEAKSNLMLITGHSTMTALEKYLRDIDAELPSDYSDRLK